MANPLIDTLKVIGLEYDRLFQAAGGKPLTTPGLLQDIFPDTTFTLFRTFEEAYNLISDGTSEARRKRIRLVSDLRLLRSESVHARRASDSVHANDSSASDSSQGSHGRRAGSEMAR